MIEPSPFPAPALALDSDSSGQDPGAPPAPNDVALLDDYSRVVSDVVERVGPSVVRVDVRKQGRSAGSGSGVIIASDGLALTNSHVVQGSRTVNLITLEGRELQARVLGDDPDTDLALLRVEADVKLALGQFTIAQAADYLARTVPMDRQTAEAEAAGFSTAPGLAIAYEVGKLQIERMLAERRLQQGDQFKVQEFDDYVWNNGNVPLSLQRWELLGLNDDIKRTDELAK